jgi:phosphoribosylamine-glycine ligase
VEKDSMILFFSYSGESFPLAWRLKQEGTDVAVYVHNPRYRSNYTRMVKTVLLNGLKDVLKKTDLTVFDITRDNKKSKEDIGLLKTFGLKTSLDSIFGPVADKLKKSHRVIGGAEWCEEIELNRLLGSDIAKKIGMTISETHDFVGLKKGIQFLKGSKDLWVLKPHDNCEMDLTYVEKNRGELAQKFDKDIPKQISQDGGNPEKWEYMLQKKVEGIEISTEAWFDGKEFKHFNHTIEDKKMCVGGLGRTIGSQGNTVWMKRDPGGLLVNEIKKLKPWLLKANYVGPVDINSIVSEDDHKAYFLEFSPRFGYDALYCLLRLYKGPLTHFLMSGFQGEFADGFASSQRITIPPFPYSIPALLAGLAKDVSVQVNLDKPDFFAEDVKLNQDGELVCGGADGILGVMTGTGATIGESVGRMYGNIKKMRVGASWHYRTDGGKRAIDAMSTLKRWGVNIE